MDAAVQGTASDKRTGRGRRNNQGDEAVLNITPIKKNLKDACVLATKKDEATQKFNDKIKAIAEQSGMQSSVIRRAIMAKHGEKFDAVKREAEQLALALDAIEDEESE